MLLPAIWCTSVACLCGLAPQAVESGTGIAALLLIRLIIPESSVVQQVFMWLTASPSRVRAILVSLALVWTAGLTWGLIHHHRIDGAVVSIVAVVCDLWPVPQIMGRLLERYVSRSLSKRSVDNSQRPEESSPTA